MGHLYPLCCMGLVVSLYPVLYLLGHYSLATWAVEFRLAYLDGSFVLSSTNQTSKAACHAAFANSPLTACCQMWS